MIEDEQGYYETLAGVFGISLDDEPKAERTALWHRLRGADERWTATRGGAAFAA